MSEIQPICAILITIIINIIEHFMAQQRQGATHKRVLGSPAPPRRLSDISQQPAMEQEILKNSLECPICGVLVKNSTQLNQHIDDIHLVIENHDESPSDNAVLFEDDIKSWIKNKIKIPNVKLFDTNNLSLSDINNSLLNINDYILTPNSSSSSLSELANTPKSPRSPQRATTQLKDAKLAKKYRLQVMKSMDKSKWRKLSPRHVNKCSIANCPNTVKFKYDNSPDGLGYDLENFEHNCFVCGKIFCGEHLPTPVKINKHGVLDPVNGIWFKCCHSCYEKKPGYVTNDHSTGVCRNLYGSFKRLRSSKIEHNKLHHFKIYKRIETYISQLIDSYYDYYYGVNKKSIFKLVLFNEAKKKLTTELMGYWQNDSDCLNCGICTKEFSNLFLRKHHCRLCGSVVCDDNCSMEVPVALLAPLILNPINSSKYQQVGMKMKHEVLRICLDCKSILFKKKGYHEDVTNPCSTIIQETENLLGLKTRIELTVPKFTKLLNIFESSDDEKLLEDLERLRKELTKYLTSFEKLSKKIILMGVPDSAQDDEAMITTNELQLIMSIKIFSIGYLKRHTSVLKRFQEVLLSRRKLQKQVNNQKVIETPVGSSATNKSSSITTNSNNNNNNNNKDIAITVVDLNNTASLESADEIKHLREELMILKEQHFLIDQMIDNAKKERKFDEVVTLKENVEELNGRISEILGHLGEEYGFD
ncbi:Pep7 protein [Saccharomycopsis crataegensis]|uniref:Pep7 protein n=1 Tax=Saccharomycopsis crataegensis TaxID=43959 RepID=A0AAV5QTG7_9ASCO|nr:Pep7 protein [Saccharomycopsis crataegensis]